MYEPPFKRIKKQASQDQQPQHQPQGGYTTSNEAKLRASRIESARQLSEEMERISECIADTERDWKVRANAMDELQEVVRSGLQRRFSAPSFAGLLQTRVRDGLARQVVDTRSRVSVAASQCIVVLSAELREQLDPLVDTLVDACFAVLGTTNQVMREERERCCAGSAAQLQGWQGRSWEDPGRDNDEQEPPAEAACCRVPRGCPAAQQVLPRRDAGEGVCGDRGCCEERNPRQRAAGEGQRDELVLDAALAVA